MDPGWLDGVAQYLVLTHLSQRANNPHLAKDLREVALQERAPSSVVHQVTCRFPKEPTPWIEV